MLRSFSWFIGVIGLLLLGSSPLIAQSPREQLQQMVQQLQRNPNDNALRERIIKLAQEIKPSPVIPDEAIRLEGRAQFRFKNAKSSEDFATTAK